MASTGGLSQFVAREQRVKRSFFRSASCLVEPQEIHDAKVL